MPTVDLSVGHGVRPDGTYDPGATAEGGSPSEQSAGDVIVDTAVDTLEWHGAEIVGNEAYTDDPNYDGSIDRVNADPLPDLAVTIHHDWRGAPRGFFCHWWEGSGAKVAADAMYNRARGAGFPHRPDWHRPRNLAFVRETNCHAVLAEVDRIGALSKDELVRMGDEVIGAGILEYFGIPHTPKRDRDKPDYDVAIIYKPNSPDDVAARSLALEHIFRLLPLGHDETIGHAIMFGSAAQHAKYYDVPTTIVAGADRNKTADILIDVTGQGTTTEREHPTVEDLKAGASA